MLITIILSLRREREGEDDKYYLKVN